MTILTRLLSSIFIFSFCSIAYAVKEYATEFGSFAALEVYTPNNIPSIAGGWSRDSGSYSVSTQYTTDKVFIGPTVNRCPGALSTCSFEIASTSGSSSDFIFRLAATSSAEFPAVSFGRSRGTLDAPTATRPFDYVGGINAYAYRADNVWHPTSSIYFQSDGIVSGTTGPGSIIFTTASSTMPFPNERMKIFSSGNVGIGLFDANEPKEKLQVDGSIYVGGIHVDGSIYSNHSDCNQLCRVSNFIGCKDTGTCIAD